MRRGEDQEEGNHRGGEKRDEEMKRKGNKKRAHV